MEIDNEKALIQYLRNGQDEGFTLLYAIYGNRIFNLAYRMIGNIADAEDITQETFVQVYLHIDQFRGESQFYTWIYTIAKNQCFLQLKKRKKNSFSSMEALINAAQSDSKMETFRDREKQILLSQIKDGCFTGLLRCLSFNRRMAFILHVLLDLPVRDVADILGKSEGATKVLVLRARRNLKEFLCKNCSLYDPNNSCRCENLLSFSLAKSWVKRPTNDQLEEPHSTELDSIQAEVEGMRKVVELYKTLSDQRFPNELTQKIQDAIQNEHWKILSH
jgi:RNA polymerase sigma factor (sigma-70 family)